MPDIETLVANNRAWSRKMTSNHPEFFKGLVDQQAPEYLWIGCSDSRVPANEVVGLMPGELFVHRNVANLVYPADLNCLSVVAYAVFTLKVRHIIVCGHYNCGGVSAALERQSHGIIDNWLSKIKDIYVRHREDIDSLTEHSARVNRMCELNVIEQVKSLAHTTIIQDAWARGQPLSIHGWIYALEDGLVNDLGVRVDHLDQIASPYRFLRDDVSSPNASEPPPGH